MRVLGATLAALLLLAAPAWGRGGPVQLGTALNSGGLDDPTYLEAVRRYDAVTPESALKLDALQPERGRYEFGFADRMVDWSVANRRPMHGTTLIWCSDAVQPAWLLSRSWTRDELLSVMRDHITTVMKHFKGRVPSWDVVNEAFASNGSRRDCLWQRVIGERWIEEALVAARAADPSAKLFYNETAADFPNAKFAAVEAMAKDFTARGVPLDGIGLQHHVITGSAPLQFLAEDAMRRIGALGLAVHVSELDAFTSQFGATAAEAADRQAQAFETVASACQNVDACFRITMWGAADNWSWRGTEQQAVALDAAYREKPGWWGIREAIRAPAVPVGSRPSPPGRPVAGAAPNAGVFTVSWPGSWDAERDPISYALEHRDADDEAWSPVATGVRSLGFSFVSGRLERQGTYRYRVRGSDGQAPGGWSPESEAVIVDRTDPLPPVITPDRPPDGGGWYRDRVTLTFSGTDPALPDGSAGSGVDASGLPAARTFAATGSYTVSGSARDRAGNTSSSTTATVRVDADASSAVLSCPGAVHQQDAASATWTAADEESGLAGPATGSLPLDTTRAGTFTARYEAADVAGHRTVATCSYVVEGAPEPGPAPAPSPAAEPSASATAEPSASATAEPSASPSSGPGAKPGPSAVGESPTPSPTAPRAVRRAAPRLRKASRVSRDGRVRLTLDCPAACAGRVTVLTGGRSVASRRYRSATVTLRLARKERRALARRRRLPVRVRVAPDGGEPRTERVTLRARR